MTDPEERLTPEWVPVLSKISRASGHELRNTLNALVVNLEVVRTRVTDPSAQPFVAQSIEQAEETVRLAESAIALLNLFVGAIGADGGLRCETSSRRGVSIEATPSEIERVQRALRGLADRGAISVDTSESAIILSIPDPAASKNRE